MTTTNKSWFEVDRSGLKQLLTGRDKAFIIFELIANAWDENISKVSVTLSRPERGRSELVVIDDSPDGFRDLSHAYTMYAPSEKKQAPQRRGRFNQGEKSVLALCDEASITSTTGQILFTAAGRRRTKKTLPAGTEFRATLSLTVAEWEAIGQRVHTLLPAAPTFYNGVQVPKRRSLASFKVTLPTVLADEDGNLRSTKRSTDVWVLRPLDGETPMLYELGIPVVETGDSWHVDVGQKVPLNQDRDNVVPAFLSAVRVAVLNHMSNQIDSKLAAEPWVRAAASDPRVDPEAFKAIIRARFGEQSVSYDPSDIGSNREAASQAYTVVTGGSLSSGEWENVRRTGALTPAGQKFPTNHGAKKPDKRYSHDEWTPHMRSYAQFVEAVSPDLVGYKVTVEYIEDPKMICGQFCGQYFIANLAQHDVSNWQANVELMLHELSHTVVKSNDHLHRDFYTTVGRLGAKLALFLALGRGVKAVGLLSRA